MTLSQTAQEAVKRLRCEKNSPQQGRIALVDPETGAVYIGRTGPEAVRAARAAKRAPKATFYAVRIGSEVVHVLKSVQLLGRVENGVTPVLEA